MQISCGTLRGMYVLYLSLSDRRIYCCLKKNGNFYTGEIQGLHTVNVEDSGLWGYYAELQSYSGRF